jgi:hypothetical protein
VKIATLSVVLSFSLASGAAAQAGTLEVTPTLGLGKLSGNGSEAWDLGVGLGVAVGARLAPNFSLAGQASYEGLSPDVPAGAGVDVSAYMLQFRVVPAFHVVKDNLDFSFAPTLGMFFVNLSAEAGGQSASGSVRGYQLGAMTSLLFAINPNVSLGPYFSYARLWATQTCEESGGSEQCDGDPENDDEGFWSVGLALKF